jgi:hypothetical protein
LETREEHDRIQEAAEAERAATKAEELRSGKRKEAVGWAKPKEGEEIELDKARLKKAIEEEKKRKNLSEAELLERAKKSKSDVSQEEMGKRFPSGIHGLSTDSLQRLIECRSRLTTILWRTTRTRRICDFLVPCRQICVVLSCIASCVLPSYASDSCLFSIHARFSRGLYENAYGTLLSRTNAGMSPYYVTAYGLRPRTNQNSSRTQAYP